MNREVFCIITFPNSVCNYLYSAQ